MKHYDLCVIGAGPAGIAAAMRAVDLGRRVLLVERDKLGGAGLHNGALSSKTMWEIAQTFHLARQLALKCGSDIPPIPFPTLQAQVAETVSTARTLLEANIEAANQAHTDGHIDLQYGQASLRSEHHVAIQTPDSLLHVEAEHIVLATGSHPRSLPGIHIDETHILSSDGIDRLTEYPRSLVILGAGVIGCEFATIFALLGQTDVFLIDKAERILPFEDEDIVHVVEQKFGQNRVHIHRKAALRSMEAIDGQVRYILSYPDGRTETHWAEKALVAVGRVPATEGLGLEEAGVSMSERGHVEDADKDTCTNCASISAVGDLTADIALVNVAELEGRHAVERILGIGSGPLCYDNVSTIMFLHPEVAGVGLNEIDARHRRIPYRAASVDFATIARAQAMHATEGFVKLLIDPDTQTVLGMRAIGEHASSTIQAVALMIRNRIPIQDLADLIHPHPSITEGVQECARALLGSHIRKGHHVRVWDWKP